jgi:hypothetical protein
MLRYNTSENICESEVTDVNTIELIEVALPHERMAYRDILLLADDWKKKSSGTSGKGNCMSQRTSSESSAPA